MLRKSTAITVQTTIAVNLSLLLFRDHGVGSIGCPDASLATALPLNASRAAQGLRRPTEMH
jgi:hypothetical protein